MAPESNSATLHSPRFTRSMMCLLKRPQKSPRVSGMSKSVRCFASTATSSTSRRSLLRSSGGGGGGADDEEEEDENEARASILAGVPAAALVSRALCLSDASCSATLMCLAKSLATLEVADVRGRERMHARALFAEGETTTSDGVALALALAVALALALALAVASEAKVDAPPPSSNLGLVSSAARLG